MPRTARIFVENACYHMITRSVGKITVFKDEDDFKKFFTLIHKYKVKYGCLIYGYCFMPNHIHLILESPLGMWAMVKFMHCVNQTYAMYFNTKYERVGHLWQNRYKNYVVLKDDYLYNLVMYIEYNPVRAGLVSRPEGYHWSSYRARVIGERSIILDNLIMIGDTSGMKKGTPLGWVLKTSLDSNHAGMI